MDPNVTPDTAAMTPEMAVEQINKMVADKLQNLLTQADLDAIKSEMEGYKSLQVKSDELMKAIAKMEGRIEAKSEKIHNEPTSKNPKGLAGKLSKAYADNIATIKDSVAKGQNFTLEVKAAGDMTIDNDYSGTYALTTLDPEVNRIPRPTRRMMEIANVGTTASKFVVYIQQTQQASSAWTAESIEKHNAEIKWEEVSSEVKKVAGFVKVSKEMLEDLAFVRSEINTVLMEQIEQAIDFSMINGAGGTDLNGIIGNVPTFNAGTFAGTIIGANIIDVIQVAKAQIQAADFMPTHIVMNPEDKAKFELTKTSTGEYTYPMFFTGAENVAGLIVVASNNISAGTILVGDFSKLIVKVREAVNLTVGYENDDFTRNMVTIIAEARLVQYIINNDFTAFVEADLATAIADLEV
jgi:HK97 family phage major capsid protein